MCFFMGLRMLGMAFQKDICASHLHPESSYSIQSQVILFEILNYYSGQLDSSF